MADYIFQFHIWILFLLLTVGTIAGFVDTLAGGGGMLTMPALLLTGLPVDAALATNKLQACFGTVSASWFLRKEINIQKLFCSIIACAAGSILGSYIIQILPNRWLQAVIPIFLIIVAALFIFIPNLGEVKQNSHGSPIFFAFCAAFPIGFYDGFLGPGAGSFFLLALILLRGHTLKQATIHAKLLNAITNVASLSAFFLGGKIVWIAGITMATGQLIGARIASGIILQKGNKIIRPMVILMSIIMSIILAIRYWF